MPDIADKAEEHIEREEAAIIAAIRAQASQDARSMVGIGECLWCGEKIDSRRFCDADCRDAWQASVGRAG